jgi:hypothetical protein
MTFSLVCIVVFFLVLVISRYIALFNMEEMTEEEQFDHEQYWEFHDRHYK